MNTQKNTVRELSAHELDMVGGGVSGSASTITVSPGSSSITQSSVSGGGTGGSTGGSTGSGGSTGGSSGGSALGGLLGGLL